MANKKSDLIGQRRQRIEKLNKLKDLGIDPYPSVSERNSQNSEIINNFDKYDGKEAVVAGRIMSWRDHGPLVFVNIQDESGQIQLYIKEETINGFDAKSQNLGFKNLELLDVGDFIEARGKITKTERGEISVEPQEIRILTKSLRPLPEKWQGLQDKELRFRRPYLDMTMDSEVRNRFARRSRFWEAHREFFDKNGFVEINIPVLEHIPGGADAKPFVTHMDAIDEDFYLRISHELPLKRLIGGGFEKVYDIGPRFRNEGISDEHLPEHVAMEYYWAYANWEDGMRFTEDLLNHVIDQVYGDKKKFEVRGFDVDFSKGWEKIDFGEIMGDKFGIDVYKPKLDTIKKKLAENNVEVDFKLNVQRGVDALWKLLRKDIAGPAFLINHPKYLSPLQKTKHDNPNVVERFQPIIAGSELGNGWSECNDPIDQYERFAKQQELRESGDEEAQWLDIDYVEMLEWGMPPTFGYGHSERTFWFLEDVSAREGVPFPQMKWHLDENTKEIYGDKIKVRGDSNSDGKSSPQPQDKSRKMVLVLSKELEGWQLTNTVGHLTAYLGSKIGEEGLVSRAKFATKDEEIPADSQYPVITLTANPGQMYNLLQKVEQEDGLVFLPYVREMIDYDDDDELAEALKKKDKKDLEYLGIGIFGDNEKIDNLTKKFSMYK